MGRIRPPALAYGLAAFFILADQVSKYWILYVLDLPSKMQVPVLPFLKFSMVWNKGFSFGLLGSPDVHEIVRWLLAAFSLAVSIALIVWVRKTDRLWSGVGVGMIIGGALGNLIDRVRYGQVADFIDVSAPHIGLLRFPWVFNVADSAITVGVIIWFVDMMLTPDKDKQSS